MNGLKVSCPDALKWWRHEYVSGTKNIYSAAWFTSYFYSAGITLEIGFHVNIKSFLWKIEKAKCLDHFTAAPGGKEENIQESQHSFSRRSRLPCHCCVDFGLIHLSEFILLLWFSVASCYNTSFQWKESQWQPHNAQYCWALLINSALGLDWVDERAWA